ncbi:MAG: sulfatase-like hydrolase/transferase [Sulfuricurvum sp.]|jgi:phosphoglycerol transferase MdoB-like AlkP superfamily enzyme|uniref:LTA synthase family protein n=1 Tax=Sulfuricurvum sp. TaxID=2025608 RepID=UPI0025D8BFD2|nr:LTA synthase family protein [Sulfuricurvum sp.]MCI4407091.1 sulfatase-like hydrolase/transferase [Sulfuricurvum sp.]
MLRELFKIYLLFIALFFLGRLGLYALYFDRLADISFTHSLLSFVYGLKLDTMTVSIILIIPAVLLSITPQIAAKFMGRLISGYVLFFLLVSLYVENATFPFVAQYDVRPNYLFIEYLKYPQEVTSMILKEYPLQLSIALGMLLLTSWAYLRFSPLRLVEAIQTPLWKRLLLFPLVAVLLFIGIRSSFGHRPANISDALYSTNRMANEIAKNSLYSIGSAFYSYTKEGNLIKPYGQKMALDEAYRRVGNKLNLKGEGEFPFNRLEPTHFPLQKPKNLVIFIQESMGAQFVGFSGGDVSITPNMEKLSHEGIAFTNLFSNGTRSIRGLAAMTSGWLPIAGEGVVKRNKSQSDFFTVASLLKPLGYKSSFIYGGEGRFDNMRSWYMGNGFDEVIEQKDYKNPSFVSTWGVSDEDLVIKANETFKTHAAKGEKFVSVMFSSSNHSPFELPEGKIDFIPGKPKKGVENAVKYADFAIGRFFDLAKKESYYKDTVFVVVADHNVRVYGDDLVPVNMFHIPALIISDGIRAQKFDTLSTQPDVLATALDLIGVNLTYPVLGHSIFSDKKQEIAFMMFNDTFALRDHNKVAILQPNKEPLTFTYENEHLKASTHDKELERDTLAFITVMDDMYNKKLFRVAK